MEKDAASFTTASTYETTFVPGAGKSMQNVLAPEVDWDEKRDEDVVKSVPSIKALKGPSVVKSETKEKPEVKLQRHISEDLLLQQLCRAVSEEVLVSQDLCDSKHLLERNTLSFQCLAQLLLSSSSLAKNRLFLFPPLEDPGIALAFNFQEPPLETDDTGIEKYKKMCKEMEIVPISRIIKSLDTDTLDLKYYGLTNKQIRALTEAMKTNGHVQTLILQDNWLTAEMTQMISDMLIENTALQYLSLFECRIGEEGAQKFGEVLSSLQNLKSLDLRFNDLGDVGLSALKDGLRDNTCIKSLNISHNNLTEDSGEILENILLENKYIEELDLSWNGFFTAQGNRRLFNGLTQSDRIKSLNLAWNGIGIVPAVRPLTRYLKKSQNLKELDISNNRLIGQSLRITRTAINKNHSLEVVKIGNNIYGPEEAHFLLTMLAGKTKDPLTFLDMENMYIKKESKPILKKISNIEKTVKIGGILSNYEILGPNPRQLIYNRCRYILFKPKRAKAKKDFGHFILSLPDHPVSPEEFQKELKKQKIKKLDKDLVQALINLFVDRKKQVDCQELIRDYMTFFPDTQLPPPKPKKGKKGKKGKKNKEKGDAKKPEEDNQQTGPGEVQKPRESVEIQNEAQKDNEGTQSKRSLVQKSITDARQLGKVASTVGNVKSTVSIKDSNLARSKSVINQ